MKKVAALILFFAHFSVSDLLSQAITSSYYPFSTSTGTVTPTGSFTQLIGTSSTNTISPLTSFGSGFEFNFAGRTFDSFSASVSGWIKLGAVGSQQYQNTVNNGINSPIIAAYSTYLTTGSTGSVSYQLTGSAPYRIFIVQWRNVTHSPYITTPVTFEMRLFESTGQIQFVYGAIPTDTYGYQAGIGCYFNALLSYAAISVTNPNSSSYANYSVNASNTLAITSGTLFQFTPDPIPAAPPINAVSTASAKCITVAFEDSSTTETYFEVWKSTDSINYTLLKQIVSTTETLTDSIYSFIDTNLPYNTIYHYRIEAHNFGATPTQSLAISDTTTWPSLSGVKHIPADYPSLGAAFEDIRCKRLAGPLVLALDTDYLPTVETYPLQFPGDTLTSLVNTITICPDTNVTGIDFSFTNSITVFDFNNASNIIIDGRPAAMGNTSVMTIRNNSTSAPAIRFLNDAHHIQLRYCNIRSSDSLSVNGVVNFGGTIFTQGNDNILIDYCDISRSTVTPRNLIYAVGIPAAENDSITISNSTFHGFNRAGPSSQTTSAIHIGAGNSRWVITGNSFYQDAALSTPANMSFVYITNTAGNNFNISENYFGGTAPQCGGSSLTLNGNGTVQFIYLNGGSTGRSLVSRNVFDNFTIGTSSLNYAINVQAGRTDIDSNRIGNQNGVFSVAVNTNSNVFMGIRCYSLDTINIFGNTIGGITSSGVTRADVQGIYVHNSVSLQVYNNIIGNPVSPNGIVVNNEGELFGITVEFLVNGANAFVQDNIVANLYLQNSVLQYNNHVSGITCHVGTIPVTNFNLHINNNRIYNLSSSAMVSGPTFLICGIYLSQNLGNCEVTGNDIGSLIQTSSTSGSVIGISTTSSSTGTINVERNNIYSLDFPFSGTQSSIGGISVNNRNGRVINNMIRLGVVADSSDFGGRATITGIGITNASTTTGNDVFHNSIYIGGINRTQGHSSMCMRLTGTAPDSVFNNIFCNTRSDTGAWGNNHAALTVPSNYQADFNFNLYYCTGNGGLYVNQYANFPAWQATGADPNSLIGDPMFLDPEGDTSTVDLHIGNYSFAEGWGYLIPTVVVDIDGDIRSANTPTDVGADCGNVLPNALEDQGVDAELSIAPNPFTDNVSIIVPMVAGSEFTLKVFDISGALILSREITILNGCYTITDLSGLPAGYYYLEVVSESYRGGVKVCKQ